MNKLSIEKADSASEQQGAPERHVVLINPEIHWNTGNIGRTCLGANATLHLIRPLGFSIDNREIKRAGLDYWKQVKLSVWDNFDLFMRAMQPGGNEVMVLSKHGQKPFWEMPQLRRMFLLFGPETKPIPKNIFQKYERSSFHIPISDEIRCLNLSTAVGIILYESLRSFQPKHAWKNFSQPPGFHAPDHE
jgi:tRNA (cytidine/uridine-2'-O-)-methyltransferase